MGANAAGTVGYTAACAPPAGASWLLIGSRPRAACPEARRAIDEGEPAMPAKRLLVVDDDDLFRESLGQNLVEAGFEVESFASGKDALQFFRDGGKSDLMVLDWKMPGMTGIEVLRQLRRDGVEVAVIFLTALSDQIYEESAFATGAVDFVEKSRSFAILRKRIELILGGAKAPARVEPSSGPVLVGELELRLDAHCALWKGRQIPLTLSEFRVVHELASRAGVDVDYRRIYDIVRGEGFIAGEGSEGYRANVRSFLKRVRQKFREADDEFDQIGNFPPSSTASSATPKRTSASCCCPAWASAAS
jgi:two-component system response regulator ChvI